MATKKPKSNNKTTNKKRAVIGHWKVAALDEFMTCTHLLTGAEVNVYPRANRCEITVGYKGQGIGMETIFDWDPISDAVTLNTWWAGDKNVLRNDLLNYLKHLFAEPEIKETMREMAIRVMEHFASLRQLKVNAKGILTVRQGKYGDGETKQLNFRTLQFRTGCRGPWYPMKLDFWEKGQEFNYEFFDADFGHKRWVGAFGGNCSCYNEIVYKLYEAWCLKTGRAVQSVVEDGQIAGMTAVSIVTKVPTKGERPDHLRIVK